MFFLNLGLTFITGCHLINCSQTLMTPHDIFCDWWVFMENTPKVQRGQHWLSTDHLLHCSLCVNPGPQAIHNDSRLKPVLAVTAHSAWWLLCDSWLWPVLSWLLTYWQGCWWHLNPASAIIFDMFRASFWLVNLPFK